MEFYPHDDVSSIQSSYNQNPQVTIMDAPQDDPRRQFFGFNIPLQRIQIFFPDRNLLFDLPLNIPDRCIEDNKHLARANDGNPAYVWDANENTLKGYENTSDIIALDHEQGFTLQTGIFTFAPLRELSNAISSESRDFSHDDMDTEDIETIPENSQSLFSVFSLNTNPIKKGFGESVYKSLQDNATSFVRKIQYIFGPGEQPQKFIALKPFIGHKKVLENVCEIKNKIIGIADEIGIETQTIASSKEKTKNKSTSAAVPYLEKAVHEANICKAVTFSIENFYSRLLKDKAILNQDLIQNIDEKTRRSPTYAAELFEKAENSLNNIEAFIDLQDNQKEGMLSSSIPLSTVSNTMIQAKDPVLARECGDGTWQLLKAQVDSNGGWAPNSHYNPEYWQGCTLSSKSLNDGESITFKDQDNQDLKYYACVAMKPIRFTLPLVSPSKYLSEQQSLQQNFSANR